MPYTGSNSPVSDPPAIRPLALIQPATLESFTRLLIPDTLVGLRLLLGFAFFLRTLEEDP
jgi:hypothetical protein